MTSQSGGISFLGGLTLVLVGLKLSGSISWSWWWVLSPLWLSACTGLALFLLLGFMAWRKTHNR